MMAAAMGATISLVMVLTVVIAHHMGVIRKSSGSQCFRRLVRIAGHTAIQLDTC